MKTRLGDEMSPFSSPDENKCDEIRFLHFKGFDIEVGVGQKFVNRLIGLIVENMLHNGNNKIYQILILTVNICFLYVLFPFYKKIVFILLLLTSNSLKH